MWGVLGNAANVGGLIGVNLAGLIAKIRQAARTAQQNRDDCEVLARHVCRLGDLLPRLMEDPAAARALDGLDATLLEAHDLVVSCQAKGRISRLLAASAMADRFRLVEKKINNHLSLVPVISYVAGRSRTGSRRLDLDDDATTSQLDESSSSGGAAEGGHRFTLTELAVATSNFAAVHVLSDDAGSGSGTKVYKGVSERDRIDHDRNIVLG